LSGPPPSPRRPAGRLRSILDRIPFRALLLFTLLIGGIVGLGAFTFVYAEGASYLSNDPGACVNCHVMQDVFDRWSHGTHKAVAVCNDCHTPHTPAAKWMVKGLNGVNHSTRFTLGNFPEPIRITDRNRTVAADNCIYCHGNLAGEISHLNSDDPTDCLHCHAGVGHGR